MKREKIPHDARGSRMRRSVFWGAIALLVMMVSGVSLVQMNGNMNMTGNAMMGSGTPAIPERYRPGEKIFRASCSGCHPGGGNSIQHNRPIINSAQLSDFDTFNRFIRTPKEPDGSRGMMPPFPTSRISDRQSKELYRYIVHVLEKRGGGGKSEQ